MGWCRREGGPLWSGGRGHVMSHALGEQLENIPMEELYYYGIGSKFKNVKKIKNCTIFITFFIVTYNT